uniref:pyridoxal kinase-like n=1 Tax=Styela clava TaxID=7725 RepID=UPI00193A1A53|nr:pyridoxal kinase-like [Styela clava]
MDECRVLSIQSHVVRGYVGNRSAVFPLQILGFEVDFINSVQFSNHTGYPVWKGPVLSCTEIEELYETLKANDVIKYDYVLTGYCYDKDMLLKLVHIIKELKERNPNLIYVCDPVMGDTWNGKGKMYVPENIMPVFRDQVVPIADILTPNQFEAELLTGMKIKNESDALKCMQVLHERGPNTVVLSSTELGESGKHMMCYCSRKGEKYQQLRVSIPVIGEAFVGSGDLFAATFLAWSHRHPKDMKTVCEKVLSTMQHVLKRTQTAAEALAGPGKKPTLPQLELKLIQSKRDIEDPTICIKAEEIKS